jgi:hypothetical protein
MIPTALLLMLLVHTDDVPETRPMDRAEFKQAQLGAALDWSDAEDRLRLTVRPGQPETGKPLRFDLQLGSFHGPAYDGPVVLQLRPPDASTAGVTVPLQKQDGGWSGSSTLEYPGAWTVDVRFRTTRNKHVQAPLVVKPGFAVPWPELTVIGLIASVLAFSLYRATATPPSEAPPPDSAPPGPP